MAPFAATTSDEPGQVRVRLTGECDLAVGEQLSTVLLDAVRRCGVVVVDLAEVEFLDSSGVHGLVAAHRAARERGGHLYLEHPTGAVATVLDVTGVTGLLGRAESRGGGGGESRRGGGGDGQDGSRGEDRDQSRGEGRDEPVGG